MDDDEILPDTLNKAWKDDKTRFGYKMLSKFGWTEEKGLGKDESGAITALKVQKRDVGLGIGMTEDMAGQMAWNESNSSFNAVLELLKQDFKKPDDLVVKKKKKSKSTIVQVGMK
jgi:Pin2-interacting protein X1